MTEEMWAEVEEENQEMCWVRSQARSGNSEEEVRTGERWIWPGPGGSCFSIVSFTNLSPPSLGEILNCLCLFYCLPVSLWHAMCYYSFILE